MTPDTPPANGNPPVRPPHRKTPPATPAVQAWLDGEADKDRLTDPDEQETAELWTRINTEAERLRRRQTPIHVQQKILSSLPEVPPGSAAASPTGTAGSITLRVSTAILAGAALLAIGALFGTIFLGR
jgi:hypothetical protein